MESVFRLKKFIGYQWKAKSKYYLHSPFVYQFYLNILEGKDNEDINVLAKLRRRLKDSGAKLAVTDLGTGQKKESKVRDLERVTAVPHKYGKILYRVSAHFNPQTVLEFGTSIGISTAYLARGNRNAKIISMEGSAALAEAARKNLESVQASNVEIRTGNFDSILPAIIDVLPSLDMVYFDGNHQKAATLKYFELCLAKANEHSIFIFDDIYWSREMTEAWEEIKKHSRVRLTLDIYRFGICFFMKEKLAKEDFVLRY
jgi:predicted O-methyltransferase YrrM